MCPKPVFFSFLVGLFFALSPGFADADQKLVMKVGSIPITSYELQRETQRMLPLNVSFHGGVSAEKIEEVRKKALERLIERAYKTQWAISQEVVVDNISVEKRLEAVRSRFKSPGEFEAALGGETVAGFRASLYREMLAAKAEEVAVVSKVTVGDKEVLDYYETNKATFKRPKQFKASHILTKVDPASNSEERKVLKEKAEGLAERARAGEDFYNLAYYNSDDRSKFVGGDLGYFHEGQVASEFEEAIKKMKAGEISGPVKTRFGFHVIKLVEINEARQLTFEETKGKIRQRLEDREREALYGKWMNQLKAQYPVEPIPGK